MPSPAELWELDTRHLAALAAIARTRSISKAADELGYGQSAVSQQLAALERVVGHRLVDRGTGPRPVSLTAAGQRLLSHAQWILDRLDAARADLDQLIRGESGSIRIGTFQSASARLLPRVLAVFRRDWPAIEVAIHSEETSALGLADLVRDGALDVAFVEIATIGAGLDHIVLLQDQFVALVPPSHRLAKRRKINLADLAGEDLVGGHIADTCTAMGERALQNSGVELNVVFRTEDNAARQRMVDAGLGCAVVPSLTVEPSLNDGAAIVPLVEDVHRTICLVWSAERTKSFALQKFIETAKATI